MDLRAIAMGLTFAFMWSSAFTSARILVELAPPLTALAVRFATSGTLAMLIAWYMGQNFQLTRGQWKATIVFGICQNALYLGLNFVAMQWIEASVAAIIASTMPLMAAFLGWAFFREKLPSMAIFGLFAGVVGVAIIMSGRISGEGIDITGLIFCFIGALGLAVATLSVRGALAGGNMMMIVGLQMWIGAVILAVIGLATETQFIIFNWSLVMAFTYTTLVPGLAATFIWFALVSRIGAVRASVFHFLNPFLGVAVAAVILGESLGLMDIIGVAVITGAIIMVQMSKSPAR
ncbi:DMT family transporter [Halocynthiibacter sp.]|uniref:DMT family transporter n=1 Tax=Halocynthiibacter sp. TaxID=1979210 RepID=UPI003C6049D2